MTQIWENRALILVMFQIFKEVRPMITQEWALDGSYRSAFINSPNKYVSIEDFGPQIVSDEVFNYRYRQSTKVNPKDCSNQRS